MNLQDGIRLNWSEIIRRVWENGLIIDERYYPAESHKDNVQTVINDRHVDRLHTITLEHEKANVTTNVVYVSVEREIKLMRQVAGVKEIVIDHPVPVMHTTIVDKLVNFDITLTREVAVINKISVDKPVEHQVIVENIIDVIQDVPRFQMHDPII